MEDPPFGVFKDDFSMQEVLRWVKFISQMFSRMLIVLNFPQTEYLE